MEIGNYVNLFPVTFERTYFRVVQIGREKYPSLRALRSKLQSASAYAVENKVYGFGSDFTALTLLGFTETEVSIYESPKLTTAIIKDGISRHAIELGYDLEYGFANRMFDRSKSLPLLAKEVQLFQGFEFRPSYLFDRLEQKIFFSVLIDLRYKLELEGKPASYGMISQYARSKYGDDVAYQLIMDIKCKTGDLSPFGQRNPEASRFRLGKILELVSKFENIALFDGSKMHLSQTPIRVAGEEY